MTMDEILVLASAPIDRRDELPTACTVYFVIDRWHRLLYVGQSRNMRTRWLCHDSYRDFVANHAVRVHWIEVDVKERYKIEKQHIRTLMPIMNWIGPVLRGQIAAGLIPPMVNPVWGDVEVVQTIPDPSHRPIFSRLTVRR